MPIAARTHRQSVNQHRRGEGREVPGQRGTDESIKSPVRWTPPPPSRLICSYLLAQPAEAKGSSTGVLRATSDGTGAGVLNVHACTPYRSCCHHAPCSMLHALCPWRKVPTRRGTTHTNITKHHNTSQHSSAQHNTTQPSRFNSGTIQHTQYPAHSGLAPSRGRCKIARPSTAPRCARLPRFAWAEEPDAVSLQPTQTTTAPPFGARLDPPNTISQSMASMGRHQSRQMRGHIWMHPTQSAGAREARTCIQEPGL